MTDLEKELVEALDRIVPAVDTLYRLLREVSPEDSLLTGVAGASAQAHAALQHAKAVADD